MTNPSLAIASGTFDTLHDNAEIMLAGPAFLVIGFVVTFWAARGVKAIAFLQGYKVKQTADTSSHGPAEAIPPQ